MRWDSFLPLAYKKSLVNSLVYRAWRICSSYELFHSELNFLRTVLAANSYPRTFVETIIRNFLDKQFSTSLPVFGPQKKKVFLSLPFIGDVTCLKFSRQMNRLLGKTVPWLSLRIIFRPARKLSCLSKIKSQFATLTNSGLVYKVSCHDCDAFYIGETKRLLQRRLKEHKQQSYSSLNKHASETSHTVGLDSPVILATDTSDYRLTIKEALHIKHQKAHTSLNANIRSCELMLW